jgi:hypothetical protein
VNDQMGGRTRIAGLVGAGSIALVLLFLTEPMRYLPKATLGAVIIGAAVGLIDPDAWRTLARTHRFEVIIAATTMIGVVVVGVIGALGIAGRALDRGRDPSERDPPRCRPGMGRATGPLCRREPPSERPRRTRRPCLSLGRPPVLRERQLCARTDQ